MTSTPQTVLESRLDTLSYAKENGEVAATDVKAIQTFISVYNPSNQVETPPDGDSTLKLNTCATYTARLTEAARRTTLIDADVDDVNGVLQSLSDEERSDWTVHGYSTAFRKFYDYHTFGPESDKITQVETPNGSSFDPDDVLSHKEIQELLNAADNPRDRAVFALLVFTGMRNNALRSLRIQDVDVADGIWRVNEEQTEGLKGVQKYGSKRPLLGAEGPVREWLSYHPESDNPEAYLITGRPEFGKAYPNQPIAGSTIRRIISKLVDQAENPSIEKKPTHPHMLRHAYVTMLKRDYELPDETVKFLIGHSPESRVMETSYAHLSDEDHIERAEVATGKRCASEDGSPLTPDVCTACGRSLPPDAKACQSCGAVYAPDAQAVMNRIKNDAKQESRQINLEDADSTEKIEILDELLEDPRVKATLLEKIGE